MGSFSRQVSSEASISEWLEPPTKDDDEAKAGETMTVDEDADSAGAVPRNKTPKEWLPDKPQWMFEEDGSFNRALVQGKKKPFELKNSEGRVVQTIGKQEFQEFLK